MNWLKIVLQVSDLLHDYGYQKRGNEVLYCGFTGRKMNTQVFFGPTYYQRLKHMVNDKIHRWEYSDEFFFNEILLSRLSKYHIRPSSVCHK